MSDENDSTTGAGEPAALPVAEYVLGVLDPSERAAVARAIETDPATAAEAEMWQARLAGLNAEFGEVDPPREVLPALEARLFGEPARRRSWYDSLALWRGLAAGAFAVAVIGVGLTLFEPAPAPQPAAGPNLVASLQGEESALSVMALYEPASDSIRVSASGAEPPEGSDYELWFIAPDENPVSMGVLPMGEGMVMPMDETLRTAFREGVTLAVSMEPDGGSPTGAPTGPVVASGETRAI